MLCSKLPELTLGCTRGGRGWMPPLHKVFLSFFLEDQTLAPVVFSSGSFIPRAHFETRLVMFSCYGYEIWVINSRWSRQLWVEIHVFSTSFDSESKYYVIFQVKDKKCHFSRNSSNSINQSITYFNTLRQRAKKLVQNTNVYK